MKRLKTKQIITYFVGMLICRVSFAGCYPIIPAYFAAVYLQDQGRAAFTFFLYLGALSADHPDREIRDGSARHLCSDKDVRVGEPALQSDAGGGDCRSGNCGSLRIWRGV